VLRTVSEEMHEEVFAVLKQQVSYHPTEPHWYLPFIGVDPALQGKGYASALLRHALAICDRNHQIAYLDASSPRSIPLYERHLLGKVQVGSSPPIFPMSRSTQLSN
jgi:ribosomal protein S18 acetylase RimI-like enzyme